jgi:hypothetical protein
MSVNTALTRLNQQLMSSQFSSLSGSAPPDSRNIANIVIARDLNRASQQVQIQALEVLIVMSETTADLRLAVDSRKTQLYKNCGACCTQAFPLHITQ